MIRHHPDSNILLEYTAGSLPWAMSLAVSAHLQLCPQCRQQHQQLDSVGGTLLDDCDPEVVESDVLTRLMDRIEQSEQPAETDFAETEVQQPVRQTRQPGSTSNALNSSGDPALANLPRVVKKLIGKNQPLRWKRVSPALKMSRLSSGQNRYEVAFHRICKGGKVAEHDHRGREITLVLYGSFSDADGIYTPGDFLLREPGEVHRPTATQDQECLCLSVVEAPVSVTGFLGWLVNPFLSFRPA